MTNSYKPMVQVEGEWAGNGLRFATEKEALDNAKDLMCRWFPVTAVRADPAPEIPNYRWEGKLVAV